jgi:plasmid stability protein
VSSLQVRDLPPDVHQVLKERAARAGQSLSEYVGSELAVLAGRPTVAELSDRLRHRGSFEIRPSAAEIIRAERDGRS